MFWIFRDLYRICFWGMDKYRYGCKDVALRDGLTGGGCTPLIVRRVSTGLENPGKSLN